MFVKALLTAGLVALGAAQSSNAAVIFNDDYGARPNGQDIWGTLPTTASTGVGAYGGVLTWPFSGKIDPFTPVGKALKFDTSSGDDTQMAFVPYGYTFGSDSVRLTLRAAHQKFMFQPGGFNNFAIGFAAFSASDGHNIFTDHILVQSDQIQLFLPGVNTTASVPFSSLEDTFYEFVLDYDPTKAGILGEQPYSLSINGVDVAIPVLPTTLYSPLTSFDAVAFGGRFSGGLTTRYLSNFALETFPAAVPEPGSLALFGLGLAGLRLMRRRKLTA